MKTTAGLLGTAILLIGSGLFPGQLAFASEGCLPIEAEIAMVRAYRDPITVIKLGPDQVDALRAFEADEGVAPHDWDSAWLMYRWRGEEIEAGIGFALNDCAKGWSVAYPEMVLGVLGINLGKTKK